MKNQNNPPAAFEQDPAVTARLLRELEEFFFSCWAPPKKDLTGKTPATADNNNNTERNKA